MNKILESDIAEFHEKGFLLVKNCWHFYPILLVNFEPFLLVTLLVRSISTSKLGPDLLVDLLVETKLLVTLLVRAIPTSKLQALNRLTEERH